MSHREEHITVGQCRIGVRPTTHENLPPVRCEIRSGPLWLQEFLTPKEARELAGMLLAVADDVEAREAEREHLDRVESEARDTGLEREGVPGE